MRAKSRSSLLIALLSAASSAWAWGDDPFERPQRPLTFGAIFVASPAACQRHGECCATPTVCVSRAMSHVVGIGPWPDPCEGDPCHENSVLAPRVVVEPVAHEFEYFEPVDSLPAILARPGDVRMAMARHRMAVQEAVATDNAGAEMSIPEFTSADSAQGPDVATIDMLRHAAHRLEEVAHELERCELYPRADQVRQLATELRHDARGQRPLPFGVSASVAESELPENFPADLSPPAPDEGHQSDPRITGRLRHEVENLRNQVQRLRKALGNTRDRTAE